MYAKVFASMFKGSMYGNPDGIITFMVMLVLADREGIVDMTAESISAHTSIPLDIIRRGLDYLILPDPNSRSQNEDGRRIQYLDDHRKWGWYIVNYEDYRNMRDEDERREYFKQWKRNKRAQQRAEKSQIDDIRDTVSRSRKSTVEYSGLSNMSTECPQCPTESTSQMQRHPHTQTESQSKNKSKTLRNKRAQTSGDESTTSDTETFAYLRSLYPAFSGNQADWLLAERACLQRIDEGATWEDLLAAARRFQAFVAAGGRSGPQFVDLPSKFFGNGMWEQPWTPPPTKAEIRLNGNLDTCAELKRQLFGDQHDTK